MNFTDRPNNVCHDDKLLQGVILSCVAAVKIGPSRVMQTSLTMEEIQQSTVVEQGAAILSLYCHHKPIAVDDNKDEELTFIAPTASNLKLE